jgi:acetyl-CoA/propionyl-CoA carboxylase biotin carboxyl carrier protein
MLTTVLVANRGEIAARIVRTCAELGIRSVAVYSDADAKSLHVRLADDAVRLPGVTARETYLDAERIVAAAMSSGADAVHPGYGFLSENASFAAAVESAGLTFVGPSAEVIATLGDKVSARASATAEGVPVVPGIDLGDGDPGGLRRFGGEHGWPVLIKPARGGGGVGMRVVAAPHDVATGVEIAAALEAARAEAGAAFGDRTVYAERYLSSARHIEVQVVGDRHGRLVALGDRDCSVQRRHQKLVEEAPAPGLDAALREAMADAALRVARRVGYVGAGTVEFLVQDGAFYFLEMNTRIQVEHPVTEAVLGVDLLREQLLVAGGEPLSIDAESAPRGHAIESRINAEDPARGFLPAPGTLERLSMPWRPGHYDSLLAKLIVWGPTREIALHRLREVLGGTVVEGIASTLPALCVVAAHRDFAAGGVSTRWFEQVVSPTLRTAPTPAPEAEAAPGVWIAGRFHRLPAAARTGAPGARIRPRSSRLGTSLTTAEPPAGAHQVLSPMRATVTAIAVEPGEGVSAGQVLGAVEAMKMEHPLTSLTAGRVVAVHVTVGQLVSAGDVLLVVEPEGATDAGS